MQCGSPRNLEPQTQRSDRANHPFAEPSTKLTRRDPSARSCAGRHLPVPRVCQLRKSITKAGCHRADLFLHPDATPVGCLQSGPGIVLPPNIVRAQSDGDGHGGKMPPLRFDRLAVYPNSKGDRCETAGRRIEAPRFPQKSVFVIHVALHARCGRGSLRKLEKCNQAFVLWAYRLAEAS